MARRDAEGGEQLLERFRARLHATEGLGGGGPYRIVFTSGRAEGNCQILTTAARAYAAKTNRLPHIITSAVEHPSILACCRQLVRDGLAQVSYLPVESAGGGAGTVSPRRLQAALRPNTCLVSVMAANDCTGAINNLRLLGGIAHRRQVPFHSDMTMLFGKSVVRPDANNLDSFTASFDRLHGPPGTGVLVIHEDFVQGYGLGAHVCGPENGGLRGGLNLPGIAGAYVGYCEAMQDRREKNSHLRELCRQFRKQVSDRFLAMGLDDYRAARPRVPDRNPMTPKTTKIPAPPVSETGKRYARLLDEAADKNRPAIVWVGPADPARLLPNTVCLAVVHAGFSGSLGQKRLRCRGQIVGRPTDLRVFEAIKLPPELLDCLMCLSFSDKTTREQIHDLCRNFADAVLASDI